MMKENMDVLSQQGPGDMDQHESEQFRFRDDFLDWTLDNSRITQENNKSS